MVRVDDQRWPTGPARDHWPWPHAARRRVEDQADQCGDIGVLAPLAQDLAEWRLLCGFRDGQAADRARRGRGRVQAPRRHNRLDASTACGGRRRHGPICVRIGSWVRCVAVAVGEAVARLRRRTGWPLHRDARRLMRQGDQGARGQAADRAGDPPGARASERAQARGGLTGCRPGCDAQGGRRDS